MSIIYVTEITAPDGVVEFTTADGTVVATWTPGRADDHDTADGLARFSTGGVPPALVVPVPLSLTSTRADLDALDYVLTDEFPPELARWIDVDRPAVGDNALHVKGYDGREVTHVEGPSVWLRIGGRDVGPVPAGNYRFRRHVPDLTARVVAAGTHYAEHPAVVEVRGPRDEMAWRSAHRDVAAQAYGTTRGKVSRVAEVFDGSGERVTLWTARGISALSLSL